ncbi:MAG: flagellar biosynthetic protein FliO [Mariprofundales bacterium]
MTDLVIQSISALAIVLALFAALVWLLRWMQSRTNRDPHGTIRIHQRTMLGGKHSLVEVEYAGQRLLLGLSPNAITPLMQRDTPSEQAESKPTQ